MGDPDDFTATIGFRDALGLYIFLRGREEELTEPAAKLYDRLRSYLYERLSIEEMERPEDLLSRLEKRR
jgi:hypothetical protein